MLWNTLSKIQLFVKSVDNNIALLLQLIPRIVLSLQIWATQTKRPLTELKIDEQALAKYPEDAAVPPAVWTKITLAEDKKGESRADRAGYVPDNELLPVNTGGKMEQRQTEAKNKQADEMNSIEETAYDVSNLIETEMTPLSSEYKSNEADQDDNVPLTYSGVVDNQGQAAVVPALRDLLQKRINSHKKKAQTNQDEKKVLAIPVSNEPVKTQRNPLFWYGSFMDILPGGIGGPSDKRRIPISDEQYAAHAMRLADNRFRRHPLFPVTMFNIISRTRVLRGASAALRFTNIVDFQQTLPLLTDHQKLKHCLDDLQAAEQKGDFPTFNHITDLRMRNALSGIFRQLDITQTYLPLSPKGRLQARKEMFSLMMLHGPPDIFVTVNPADIHSPLICQLAGKKVSVQLDGSVSGLPSKRERVRLVAQNPMAAALYAYRVVDAFIRTILGFRSAGKMLGFGEEVVYFTLVPEEQGRGSLHFHGTAKFKNTPSPLEFEVLLKKQDFQDRIRAFLSDLIKQEEPIEAIAQGVFAKCLINH